MSKNPVKGNEDPKPEVTKIARGLSVRKFDGKIAEDKDKKTPEIKYVYDRIVLPWSRTGKNTEGKDVEGSVPSLSELMAYIQSLGFTTEYKLDKENQPETQSVVGFLVDGLNSFLNRTARIKSENTPDTAKYAAISTFAKKMGITFAEAEKTLAEMFG